MVAAPLQPMQDNSVMNKAIFLDAATLPNTDWSPLGSNCQLVSYANTSPQEVVSRCQDADIVITNKVVLCAEVLAQLPKLKLICVAATGTNNVDLEAAKARNIAVCNVRNYATAAVSQHAFALLLALTNQINTNARAIAQGEWSRSPTFCLLTNPIQQLSGLTITIVGYGDLGQATARLAQAFGMKLCIAERPGARVIRPGRTEFITALRQADVVSLHCPAQHSDFLIGSAELAEMKPSALLINTARGALVDPLALIAALKQGKLAGAALDVLITEPPPIDDPLLTCQLSNLILSPHVAWASAHAMQELTNQVIENILSFYQGRPSRLC